MIHPYCSKKYAEGFKAIGMDPIYLPNNDIWVVKRPIPGTDLYDAANCYPVFPFSKNTDFSIDIDTFKQHNIISLVLVSDIFTQNACSNIIDQFNHIQEYKPHYIVDLKANEINYTSHHRQYVKKANLSCEVKLISLKEYLNEWIELYNVLIDKHLLTGVHKFSKSFFAEIATLEKLYMIGAFIEKKLVSAMLWIEYDGFIYSFLGASSSEGYDKMCAYAVYDYSIKYFKEKNFKAIDLGGGAGVQTSSAGLSFFKKGFSNKELNCYIYGMIIDHEAYINLSKDKNNNIKFFPLYRVA
jgi:hypothetical protein